MTAPAVPTATKSPTKKKRRRAGKSALTAKTANRHILYEASVQCVEAEIDFVDRTYRKLRGRRAVWLREDFCGTANTSCEWIKRRKTNCAVAVDNDAEPLEWGRMHHVKPLGEASERIDLVLGDVLTIQTRRTHSPMDIVLAMNFSYWTFQERDLMCRYFRRVHAALADDGLFMLDASGGPESHELREETREQEGFDYIWDQAKFNPITHEMTCYIHFAFPDGSKMRRAFTYTWRLWSLPEIREILEEAGFKNATVYWEGTDRKTEEGNGVFRATTKGEPCPSWIAYIVAEK
ncbi:MAG: hypothetical protein KAS72_04605 [Phycisphaerales bacterium]|nr:hypothetical protein [Phycisphaerales bacterium]